MNNDRPKTRPDALNQHIYRFPFSEHDRNREEIRRTEMHSITEK